MAFTYPWPIKVTFILTWLLFSKSHKFMFIVYWGSPLCEGLLYSCYIGIVQESNSLLLLLFYYYSNSICLY
jgi:hypothetical protein